MFWRAVCMAGLVLLPGTGFGDTVYKCTDGKTVTYSNTTCEKLDLKSNGVVADKVSIMPGPPVAPAARPAADKAGAKSVDKAAGKAAGGTALDAEAIPRPVVPANPVIDKLMRILPGKS